MDTKIAAVAEEIPSGNCVQALIKKAAERDVYIIAGLYEKEGIHLYNSAVLVGPEEGYIGTYRKMHMWSTEKLYCEESHTRFPVFDTRLGRIGIMICYDLWFPETIRLLTLQGADLICSPSGWVLDENIVSSEMPMANTLCIANSQRRRSSYLICMEDKELTLRSYVKLKSHIFCLI